MNRQSGFIQILFALVIAAALIIFVFYLYNTFSSGTAFNSVGGGGSSFPETTSLLNFPSNNSTPSSNSSANSPYAGTVTISPGSAESSYQPNDEYIEIYNNGGSSVDISGWTLENAFGNRPLQTTGNQQVSVAPEKVTIPNGTNFLNPSGNFATGPIILKSGDTAIVTTGGPFVSYPFKISESFRANKCSGYLNYTYPFDPQMNNDCPTPQNEPGINDITDVCYQYVRYLSTCYDPAVQDKNNLKDNFQQNCVNYIDNHFNYGACVANHENDSDFNESTWRIFLGVSHELWHAPDDSIKLYDLSGKLVSEIDY